MPAFAKMIEPEVKSLGYDLVRVCMIGGTSDPTLQVMAERPDTRQLDHRRLRAHLAAALSDVLDLCDPIEGSYRLEVSSPGIDRPLTRLKDYQRLVRPRGAHLASRAARRPQAILRHAARRGRETTSISPTRPVGSTPSTFDDIASAKLLLTDKLINATAPLSTEGAEHIETVEE